MNSWRNLGRFSLLVTVALVLFVLLAMLRSNSAAPLKAGAPPQAHRFDLPQ
ncbi:MAG: hypothetical protein RL385_1484 [Pseudomonadota bacterium]|jgi:hypothetical protein